MLVSSTYHIIPDDKVCWGAGGYSKCVGKAGNDGGANDVQSLVWECVEGTKGLQLISEVTSHALNLVSPVESHGALNSLGMRKVHLRLRTEP